jgi:Cyclin, N-terminal domain
VIDPKRISLSVISDNNYIVKSLIHGKIKKKPILNNINNISNLGQTSMICEDILENDSSKQTSNEDIPKSNLPISTTNKLNFKTLISGISINIANNIHNGNYTFNLENITISKENPPKFSNEEYRRMFTRMIRKDLGKSIIQNLFAEEESIEDFLASHKVTERMRTRMIDWMIEVLTNYKCDDNTFFIAVNTMDRYFKETENNSIQPAELHLIGVASMFMASKYEDIYPLRLKIVHEKIAHKKLSIQEIKGKETDISTNLNFVLGKPTQWDFINHFIEEIFFTNVNNFQVNDKSLIENYGNSIGLVKGHNGNLLQNFSEYEAEIFKNYTPNMINLLRHIVIYLAKMNCHDYILSIKKPLLIAASIIFVVMKICEQINIEEYVNEYFSKKLTEISQKNENEIIKTAQKILYNAQNFDTIFSGLENLKKFHFNAIIDLKNTK